MDIVILSDILLFLSPALSRKTPTQVTSSSLRASRGNDTSQFICQNEDTNLTSVTFLVTGHLDYLLEQLLVLLLVLYFFKSSILVR